MMLNEILGGGDGRTMQAKSTTQGKYFPASCLVTKRATSLTRYLFTKELHFINYTCTHSHSFTHTPPIHTHIPRKSFFLLYVELNIQISLAYSSPLPPFLLFNYTLLVLLTSLLLQ